MTATEVRPSSGAEATEAAVAAALRTIDANIAEFGDRYPGDTTVGNSYRLRPPTAGQPEGGNTGWTTSFWPGMLWLAHELTGERCYEEAATGARRELRRPDARRDRPGHPRPRLPLHAGVRAAVAAHRRPDRPRRRRWPPPTTCSTRVLEPAGIIQAWGDMDDPQQRGRTIIDSLMNTPLLFWASQVTGDGRYAEAARRHVAQLRDHILRPDDTTFHTFYWDPATGEPLRGETEQGSADDSCWARGQAWGIYGFSLNHRYTGDPSFLAAAQRCADYFLAHLPADHVAYWDLVFGDGSGEERDSSAAAIAVCGLLELAEQLPAGPRADTLPRRRRPHPRAR